VRRRTETWVTDAPGIEESYVRRKLLRACAEAGLERRDP